MLPPGRLAAGKHGNDRWHWIGEVVAGRVQTLSAQKPANRAGGDSGQKTAALIHLRTFDSRTA